MSIEVQIGKFKQRQLNTVQRLFIKINRDFDFEKMVKFSHYQMKQVIYQCDRELRNKEPDYEKLNKILDEIPRVQSQIHNHHHRKLNINGIINIKQAEEIAGTLSDEMKLPCFGYSLPPQECKKGSELAKQEGTICNSCYGFDGWYKMKFVQDPLYNRLSKLTHPQWVDAMVYQIKSRSPDYFRWHGVGDIQNFEHLANILDVVMSTPETKHWLPTSEHKLIEELWNDLSQRSLSKLFPNLSIRLSARKIDGRAPTELANKLGVQASTVVHYKFTCPASLQGDECRDCRVCWNQEIKSIKYHLH